MGDFNSAFERGGTPIKRLLEEHVVSAGGTSEDMSNPFSNAFRQGQYRLAEQIRHLVNLPKSDPNHCEPEMFSLQEILFACCPNINKGSSAVEVAEAVTASSFPKISTSVLSPGIMAAYNYELNFGGVPLEDLFVDGGDAKQKDDIVAGFTSGLGLSTVGELELYPETAITEKYVRIKTAKFGLECDVTWEAVRFDLTGEILSESAKVGKKMGLHRHKFVVQKIQDVACTATGEAAYYCLRYKEVTPGATEAVFSADHSSLDGQTNANINTTSAFAYATLQTAITSLSKMVDDEGDAVTVRPTHILVPMALHSKALQAVKSPDVYDTANRSANIIADQFAGGIRIFCSPFMDASSATTWYLGAPKEQYVWKWTRRPEVLSIGANSTDALKRDVIQQIRVSYAGGFGATDYRYMVKSTA